MAANNPNAIQRALYRALSQGADAKIAEAKATILIYLTSPVGIGEHPQHIEEMGKLLDTIAQAEDRKAMLQKHFTAYEE